MPRPPFVDTHVHFYQLDHKVLRYSWLDADAPELTDTMGSLDPIRATRYWADDFLSETRFQDVTKVVHVQAAIGSEDPVQETIWLEAFAERLGTPDGIVAALDLTGEDVPARLERHAAGSGRFRGIRDLRFDEYLDDPRWQRGLAALERHGGL
ncbi:MAG: amidohydrolase family protein, partial [Actinobacteria bacterium]|nr:amidohydrolase family protein [Actinomycetota bacterium]